MNLDLERRIQHSIKDWSNVASRSIQLSVFFGVLQGSILVIQAYFIASTLNQIIILKSSDNLVQHLLLIFALTCLRAMVHFAKEAFSFKSGKLVRETVRQALKVKLTELGPSYLNTKPEGHWNALLLEQVEQLNEYYARYLPQRSLIACIPLVILVVVFPQSWIAGLILLLTAPLIPLFMILVGKSATKAGQEHNLALQKLTSYFADRLSGLSTLKLFYRYQAELEGVTKVSEDFQRRTMSVLKRAFLSSAVLEFFSSISIALLAVYLGFSFLEYIESGFYGVKVSLFSAMFILLLAPEFYQPLRELGAFYHAKTQAVAAAESISDVLSTESNRGNVVVSNDNLVIEAHDLIVKSHTGEKLIGPVSFKWQSKDKIAIVGRSGGGKTSLINAILGFQPYEGHITVNGIELQQMDLNKWHLSIGWLGQMPKLFPMSLKDNLIMNETRLSEEQLKVTLNQVGLSQWQNQLDKEIGEANSGLSVGQAQRIALARLLLSNHQFLLLDEPTAALDPETQNTVWQLLSQSLSEKGGLIVTHKVSEMKTVDQVWFVEDGLIKHKGSFDELQGLLMPLTEKEQ
ncbi:thiol reductant ABC exporter subunit CydD [Shewanella sp. OPT22]|nr:thiol reductant ABC exporter subunit CydD [Shewanella sp. OPT22]